MGDIPSRPRGHHGDQGPVRAPLQRNGERGFQDLGKDEKAAVNREARQDAKEASANCSPILNGSRL